MLRITKRPERGMDFTGRKVLTQQAAEASCNINTIVQRYKQTGQLPVVPVKIPQYGDFSDVPSFAEAHDIVVSAEMQFNALPSKIRSRFQNNPVELMNFLGNGENRTEAIALGLIDGPPKPPDPPKPIEVIITNPSTTLPPK